MIEQATRRSRELFASGFYCAESVLMAIAESRGIRSEWIPKIATGHCSGVARTRGTCGAVNGAIMGISLVTGRSSADEKVDETYVLVRKLLEEFEKRFGSTNCRDLTGCDLGTPEGQKFFKENDVIKRCAQYVQEATGIVYALIEDK